MHHLRHTLHAMPALPGLLCSWQFITAVLLLMSPWLPAVTRVVAFGDFGAVGRFTFGCTFLALLACAIRWPVRGSGAAALFFAGTRIYDSWLHPPINLLSGFFWLLAIVWIVVAEMRAILSCDGVHVPKGAHRVEAKPAPIHSAR